MATSDNSKSVATGQEAGAVDGAASVQTLAKVAELKESFRAGSIPLESDFHQLIDMAAAGATAVGASAESAGAGDGLVLSPEGKLKINAGDGVELSTDGKLKVNAGDGFVFTDAKLGLSLGDALYIDSGKLGVRYRQPQSGHAQFAEHPGWAA